jgi:tagatose-6-phosphate ketose/aldose isomerase
MRVPAKWITTMNNKSEQFLHRNLSDLEQLKALHTAREITQQLTLWEQLGEFLAPTERALNSFLEPLLALPNLQILLTGAGTSAFIGDAIASHLKCHTELNITALASTDLVSNPALYLSKDIPTLLVSFARSGNSPESVASVDIVDRWIDQSYHLFITCNAQGELARSAQENTNRFCLQMPEQTNDQSFAMTSSYSCMYLSALHCFDEPSITLKQQQRKLLSQSATQNIDHFIKISDDIVQNPPERLVFLGSGTLQGNAREAALKCMELSAGKLIASHDSSLGFRHGPKFIVNKKTLVVVFRSNDGYTQKYDDDIVNELCADNVARVLVINPSNAQNTALQLHTHSSTLADVYQGLLGVMFAQVLAFSLSLQKGLSPDNPCPSGEVNRVVQGVIIHPDNKGNNNG